MFWTETLSQWVLAPQKRGQWSAVRRKGCLPPPWQKCESYYDFSSFARLEVMLVQLCQMRFFSSAECLMFNSSTATHSRSAETTADTSLSSQPGSFRTSRACLSVLCFVPSTMCHWSRATWGGGSSSLCHWKWPSLCWCWVGGSGEKGWM